MKAVVCGSFAYDNILHFKGKFCDHLIQSELNNINISFLCETIRREYGGCAGNIIYNLNIIGSESIVIGTLGSDAGLYLDWMKLNKINTKYIKIIKDAYTAQAYITTDENSNQITTFHPGAMQFSNEIKIPLDESISLGLISPDGRDGMIEHAKQLIEMKVPYIFDPGQGLPMFNKNELNFFNKNENWIIMNDYEFKLYCDITCLTVKDIAIKDKILIVTNGSKGSSIFTEKTHFNITAPKVENPKDPTGCGDAYRAGLVYGILEKMSLEKIGELSSALGALKVSCYGTQNHKINKEIKSLL